MWSTIKRDECLKRLKTNDQTGLSKTEVEKREKACGKNILIEKEKESILKKFLNQFNDFMIIILIIASIISAGISFVQGENDYMDSVIIIAIVILNAIMGLIQEERAEKSIEALKKLTPQIAKVVRNSRQQTINAENLVPGDIILLENGNYIPADCRLLETYNLKVEESTLTGETQAVLKNANIECKNNVALGDMVNTIFMGTMVVNGHAKAVVTNTGMETKMGKIANMINKGEIPETPIQKKLGQVGKTLGITCLVICLVIFVMGVIKKIEPIEMFMTSVGLAVAAIPEGLPAIVTIMLSIGVTKMAKNNSIIRKLPAVETLGSSNVICSDKTGTLTQNKMEVVEIFSKQKELLAELGTMCTDCQINKINGKTKIEGEATEIAIVNFAEKIGKHKKNLYKEMERIEEIPFDSKRKMMSTIHKKENAYRVITKGAPDILLEKCTNIITENGIEKLTSEKKQEIKKENENLAKKALRVIAVAFLDISELPIKIDTNTIEKNLTFVGLLGMMDPPREGVKEAVKTCKKAGIKTVMITGDHVVTATAIAKELGILTGFDKAISGNDLDKMTNQELRKEIKKYTVFARVSPEHKVRIVKAWQETGAIVAMTGDGVNDSPALKSSDIGISMGKNGTDVAKNASDMILTDDNFVTIVKAVKQGRNIYDNIKKAIHFLIATNIGEIVVIFMGLVLGFKSPLLAIQLLWINLITDSIPALAIGLEPPEKDIMLRKPINSKKGIFSDGLWNKIITEGIMLGLLTLVAFSIGNKYYGIEIARTMAFVSLGILELIHSFNIKSEKSIFKIGILENKFLIASFILGVLLQIIVVITPITAQIFELVPLNKIQWIITIGISILPIPIMEIQKKRELGIGDDPRILTTTGDKQGKRDMLDF